MHPIISFFRSFTIIQVVAKITHYIPEWRSNKHRRSRRTRLVEKIANKMHAGEASGSIAARGRYDAWAEQGYTGPPLDGLPSSFVTAKVLKGLVIDDAYLRRGELEGPAKEEDVEVDVENDEIEEFPEFVQGSARANHGAEEIEDADAVATGTNAALVEDAFAPNFPANDDVPAPPPPDAFADFDAWFSSHDGPPN